MARNFQDSEMAIKRRTSPSPAGTRPGPSIRAILDDAINKVTASGAADLTKQADAARFLGVSPSYLSKLRSGKQALPVKSAADFARRLSNGDADIEEALRASFLEASGLGPGSQATPHLVEPDVQPRDQFARRVEQFFAKLAQPNRLLCVDYRDLPQAVPDGPYPRAARFAGEAVAKGLSFAMFQPFGTEEELKRERNNASDNDPFYNLFEYLFDLAREVRQVYREMKRIAKRDGALGSIVLYEATSVFRDEAKPVPLDPTGCGIQSRTFFVDYEENARHIAKVYEWVVAEPEHFFVERSSQSIHVQAVREQFSPVTSYWSEHHDLPKQKDLQEWYDKRPKTGLPVQRRWKQWSE